MTTSVVPSSGTIKLSQIATQFGLGTTTPLSFSMLAGLTFNSSTSGSIDLTQFYQAGTPSVNVQGLYGMSPWGAATGFPDSAAYYIWNRTNAYSSAPANPYPSSSPVILFLVYNNTTSNPINATSYTLVDNDCDLFVNGKYAGHQNTFTTAKVLSCVLRAGINIVSYKCYNGVAGPAGVCASFYNGSTMLFHTDSSWKWINTVATPTTFALTISSTTTNYSVYNAAVAAGWNASTAATFNVTVNSGVAVYSTNTSVPAIYVENWFNGTGCTINITNNGTVVGCGGQGGNGAYTESNGTHHVGGSGNSGGTAIICDYPTTIQNNGTIAAGAGGGAGSSTGGYAPGGNGGGGAAFGAPGNAPLVPVNGYGYVYATAATAGTLTVGGTGGRGATASY